MTAAAIGGLTAHALAAAATAAAGGRRPARSGAPHRTGAPVLRNSVEAGTFEDTFFTVPAPGEADGWYYAAKKALDAGRRLARIERSGERKLSRAERAIASMTAGALRVFEEICALARLNRGQVFPTYEWLADRTALGRTTVARSLAILQDIGFLVRQRRFKKVEEEGWGRRYKQTSNAYRAMTPKGILSHLPRWMRRSPTPCDEVQREADRQDDQAHMLASLSCRDLARTTVGGALGAMLMKLGEAVDARSSASTEPVLNR